uniref:Uncharacterized protein n=1 Tax=Rhizophora mucronata TaxID=61149 RepID=A0A2P2PZR2_RHIMU
MFYIYWLNSPFRPATQSLYIGFCRIETVFRLLYFDTVINYLHWFLWNKNCLVLNLY